MFKNLRLALKIGGGFSLILLLTCAITLIGWNGMNSISESVVKADDANRSVKDMLAIRNVEKNYIHRGDSQYLTQIRIDIANLQNSVAQSISRLKNREDIALMENAADSINAYAEAFENYVSYKATDDSAESLMTQAAQNLEAEAEEIRKEQKAEYAVLLENGADKTLLADKLQKADDANRLIKMALDTRRLEKNYAIRKSESYIEQIRSNINQIKTLTADMKTRFRQEHNIAQVTSVLTSTKNYETAFDNWIENHMLMDAAENSMVEKARDAISDVTELRQIQKTRMQKDTERAVNIMITGALIALLAGVAFAVLITYSITRAMRKGVEFAYSMSTGNMGAVLDVSQRDEIGQLADALRNMQQKFIEIVTTVQNASDNVFSGSEQLSSTAQEMSQGASEQAASAEEVSASMEEMSSNIKQNADNAMQTEKMAAKAARDAQDGGKAVRETVEAMTVIASKISIIEEIARQTNMLSLNASIEAARAGEYGTGFAVVASEVGKLAERSQIAAGEISSLAADSVEIAEKAGNTIENMIPDIQKTAELIQEISTASREQDTGADQITTAISQLDSVIQQNASASEESASMAEELSAQATLLQDAMSYFTFEASQEVLALSETIEPGKLIAESSPKQ